MVESPEEDLAMREVDDALRRKELENLWKKYGVYVIGLIVAIIVIVAGNATYVTLKQSSEEASSEAFSDALDQANEDGADVAAVWQESLAGLDANYGYMGQMHLAASHVKAKNYEEALKVYASIAASDDADARLKDLSSFYTGVIQMEYIKDYAAARSQFMLVSGRTESAFNLSATEQLAVLDIMEENNASALATLKSITSNNDATAAMKQRANKLISLVESRMANQPAAESAEPEPVESAEPVE